MSTEATGGGQPGADGAAEPDAAAAGAEPAAKTVTAPTAWDTTTPSAWGAPAAGTDTAGSAALVPGQATAPDETAAAAGSDVAADEAPVSPEPPQPDEASSEPEPADADDAVLDAAGPADEQPDKGDEPSEPDEALEVDGADTPRDNGEPAETEAPGADGDPEDVGYPDGGAEYDEDYAEDEAAADDEEYAGYESGEAAAPRRARRWPRVLLALGFVVLGAAIVGGAVAIVGSITHGFKKPVKITYKKSPLFSLKTGECFNPQGQSYSLISCDSPHQAEVFATFSLSGTTYPGATAIAAQASDGCTSRLTGYVNPQLALSLTSTYVYPDSVAWQAGTRTVICEVRAASGTLTGSVRSASAS